MSRLRHRSGRDLNETAKAAAERDVLEKAKERWAELAEAAAEASEDTLAGMGYASPFHFARALRAFDFSSPDGRRLSGEDVAEYVEATFEHVQTALPLSDEDAWEALPLYSESGDIRAEFVRAYDTVRVPKDHGLWQTALQNARERPFTPKEHAKNPKYVLFVSVAGHLQLALPRGAEISLPVKKVAAVLNVSEQMVSVYRGWAVEAGLLREVQAYNRERHFATRFRFALDRFNR